MPPVMALSVQRPWAHSILLHGKDVENRTWAPSYRGWLVIHASNGFDPAGLDPLYSIGYAPSEDAKDWPRGYLGIIRLVDVCAGDCFRTNSRGIRIGCSWWAAEGQKHLTLANPLLFPEPIPGRGRLGVYAVTGDDGDRLRAASQQVYREQEARRG